MTGQFINPITMSFALLERYKTILQENLHGGGLDDNDVDSILRSVQFDTGLFFSLNRKYKRELTSFATFCREHTLSDILPQMFPTLTNLYAHQRRAICSILERRHTVVSTGTGSGKTETFMIPILDRCLKSRARGIKALLVYPMNALANDQVSRLAKATAGTPITFGSYTRATPYEAGSGVGKPLAPNHLAYREEIMKKLPDILITNPVMLDRMLTRSKELKMFVESRETLEFIVLDELHTYRGNKATNLKYLLNRLKSHLNENVVQIGTSATLTSQKGYLASEKEAMLRAFILPLLGVDQYEYVEPEFEEEAEITPAMTPAFNVESRFGWDFEVSSRALETIGLLTGEQFDEFDLAPQDFRESRPFKAMQRNKFVIRLRKRLLEGVTSFNELVNLLVGMLPAALSDGRVEEILKSYLSSICYVNHQSGKEPLLDFRIHLFLRDIGGHLKRCLKCESYHSGRQDQCQQCGYPLFYVYREDISKCVGKVRNNRLRQELRKESDDPKNCYYVLISDYGSADDNDLHFREGVAVTGDELILEHADYGSLRLSLLPASTFHDIEGSLIPLIDRIKDYEYLYNLAKSLLDFQPSPGKKLLAFIDNREKASRLSSVLADEFVSDFLEECLKFYSPGRASWT